MENKWISVDVKLPDSDKPVLIWYEYFRHGKYNRMYQTYGIGYCMKQSTGERWWYIDQGGYKAKVLYWCQLPSPVKVEEEPPEENEESESLKVREVFGKPIKAGLSAGLTDRSKSENDAGGKMTPEKAIEQLQTLIEDAESHREPDGSLDKIYQDDIAALNFAIEAIKAFDEMDESLTAILKECVSG